MIQLEQYYKEGEWKNLVALFDGLWTATKEQIQLLEELNENKEVAVVVWGLFGNSYKDWLIKSIPALDNLRPKDCLLDVELNKRLKTYLLRMPY